MLRLPCPSRLPHAPEHEAPGREGHGQIGVSQRWPGGSGALGVLPKPPHLGQRTKPLSGPSHSGHLPMTTQDSLRFSPVPWHWGQMTWPLPRHRGQSPS